MDLSELSKVLEPTLSRQLYSMAQNYQDVINFTLGDPDIPTPKGICDVAYKATINGKTRYTPNAGIIELRESIAKITSKEYGIPYTSQNVAITTGATEAIYLTLLSILNKGDEVIILAPYWVQYENITKMCGACAIIIDGYEDYETCLQKIERSITSRTKAIIINSPNNPSGTIYPELFIKSICELVEQKELYLLSDEVYKNLIYEKKYISASLFCQKENLIIFNSFSKAFAMTGWRIGYAIADEKLISTIVKLQQNVAVCVSSPAQYAALEAINNSCKYIEMIRNSFEARRNVLCAELDKCTKIKYRKPEGTFYSFIDIHDTGLDSKSFCFSLLEKEHVSTIPGIAFGNSFNNYIRLAFTVNEDKIIEGIARIKHFVDTL